jgi:hypothetical protein
VTRAAGSACSRTTRGIHGLYVSIAILAAGWSVGLAIYLSALDDEQLPFELTDASKLYVYRLQQLGGKSALMYQEMNDFLASLWHAT